MDRKYFKFKGSVSATGEVEGYGSVFGNVDLTGDVVKAGAFTASIKSMKAAGDPLPMLFSHDPEQPIGVWTELREDSRGLYCKGQINMDVQRGREAHSLMAQKCLRGLSIGYDVVKQKQEKDYRALTELRLWEISPCVFPANQKATVESVKSALAALRTDAKAMGPFFQNFDDMAADRLLSARRMALLAVLDSVTYDILFDMHASNDEKLAAFDECLNQFHAAQLAWMNDYLAEEESESADEAAAEGDKSAPAVAEAKVGRKLSAETKKSLMQIHDHVHQARSKCSALLKSEAAKDPEKSLQSDDAETKGAAEATGDPAQHSQSQENEQPSDAEIVSEDFGKLLADLRRPLVSPATDSAAR